MTKAFAGFVSAADAGCDDNTEAAWRFLNSVYPAKTKAVTRRAARPASNFGPAEFFGSTNSSFS
jgi:hypothetical protein